MLKICSSLFLTGIALGAGPCLATCGPILVSYIAATKDSPLSGLKSWLIFSMSRVLVYVALGVAAGFAGAELFKHYYWEMPGYIIWLAGGTFITFLGILIFLGKDANFKGCSLLNRLFIEKDIKSLVVMGILVGIFPCVPLMGVYSYITMISQDISHGVLMSAAFGLGTIISPMIFLGILAGTLPRLNILKNEKNLLVFRRVSAAALTLLGAHIIVRTACAYIKSIR